MRKCLPILLALMVPLAGAEGGSLRDRQQVDIAPAIEGREGPAGFGMPLAPKAGNAPPMVTAEAPPSVPETRAPSSPLRPERGLGLTFGLDEDGLPPLLSPGDGADFAGMIQFRKPLP
ncbi:hypothetical protein [Zavarzinia compransoris]|uniref:Uncharacterized protein n=1 Tax=Zavarzinia compransoris TaxID=1264899 RepID=A0A317E6R7_9PROT|nr:hypothetical protein [Zavarzinia compransoris]PWR20755.1 hypothetical protein DKG75_12225 [Zavarzinia compransoris]TDP44412.1 hypothetical protein DES42_107179 [Zavarzinia compransoris]